MADNILESEYITLCEEFPFFKHVGHKGFGVKVWLIFRALNFGNVSLESVASNPCQSLMQNDISFNLMKRFLTELHDDKIFQGTTEGYKLLPEHSYELHRICYHLGEKISKKNMKLKEMIIECGFQNDSRNNTLINNFETGDVNAKTNTLKDILSQLAFSGARFLIKIIDKGTDKMD